MPSIDRDGVRIYYEVSGTGPAILLTHGYSATHAMWQGQLASLAADHSVITWDMRGHGHSAAPRDDALYSQGLTVADMGALLDQCGFERAIVGGLSLGGYMSLAFHAAHPERVDALLIIDCGPGYKNDAAREAWNQTAFARAAAIEREGAAALTAASAEQASAQHDDVQGLVFAARNMLTQQDATVIRSLPDIQVPALVVVGADDEPFLAASDYMANKIPGAEKLVIANGGHAVNIDQPQAFNQGVRSFLDQHGL